MDKPIQTHVLFDFSPLDCWEEIDDKIQKNYQNVKQLIANKTPKECQDIYVKHIQSSSGPQPQANNNNQNLEELTMGLLIAILVEQDGQQISRYYRDVVTLNKDGLALFSTYLNMFIIERLSKIKDHSIKQIFWITNQLMKAGVVSAETVCSNLFRQTAGGDLSAKNLWLAENLLGLLNENRTWLINSTSFMIPTTIYTFMRLIADHLGPAQSDLRKKETDFVIGLIRERFLDCIQIGRDFLRLLYNIVKLPEFERLWNDIFNNPKSLHPTFQNPLQLLTTRTPRRLFQSRLTFEMERKISFLATQVKFGNQKRYQDWFHKQFLSTPESLSLRSDLIRYICAIIHPSNEVLCSDIIPRWAIIGWLLVPNNASTSGNATTSSKLALFYDWLVYDPKIDNIMNIEPAILLMHYSIRSHPAMTASLLDYLCRIPVNFAPKLSESMKAGIKNSIHQILEKRVIQTITHLFDNPKFEPALRTLIRENFTEFINSPTHIDNGVVQPSANQTTNNLITTNTASSKQPEIQTICPDPQPVTPELTIVSDSKLSGQQREVNAVTKRRPTSTNSQIEDKQPAKEVLANDGVKHVHTGNGMDGPQKSLQERTRKTMTPNLSYPARDLPEALANPDTMSTSAAIVSTSQKLIQTAEDPPDWQGQNNLSINDENNTSKVLYPFFQVRQPNSDEILECVDDPVRKILEDLGTKSSTEDRCSLMDKLISTVFDNSEQSASAATLKCIAHCLAYNLMDDFTIRIFPSESSRDNGSLEESINSPFFLLCRSAFASKLSHTAHRPMVLLAAVSEFLPATGFLVLYFLRVKVVVHSANVLHHAYLKFCKQANRDLTSCLQDDLTKLLAYDSEMFCFLLPSIFGELAIGGSFHVTGNIELIRLVVSAIDPIHLQEIISLCMTSMAKLFNKDSPLPVIEASLKWESWEQYCLWKLISAQNVPLENYVTILPKLSPKTNAEALSCIMLNLQKVSEPTCTMVEQVMECDPKSNELFATSILRFWSIRTDMKNLVNHIISVYESQPTSPPIKRKGQPKSSKNSSLTPRNERVLTHLAAIKARAPKNKLISQPEIVEMLTQAESICNDSQRKKLADLLTNVPNTSKKVKKDP